MEIEDLKISGGDQSSLTGLAVLRRGAPVLRCASCRANYNRASGALAPKLESWHRYLGGGGFSEHASRRFRGAPPRMIQSSLTGLAVFRRGPRHCAALRAGLITTAPPALDAHTPNRERKSKAPPSQTEDGAPGSSTAKENVHVGRSAHGLQRFRNNEENGDWKFNGKGALSGVRENRRRLLRARGRGWGRGRDRWCRRRRGRARR